METLALQDDITTLPTANEVASSGHFLRRIELTYFRNYSSLALEIESSFVILSGANGAGKTNILEAISLLSPGSGLRKAKLSAMTHRHAPPAAGWVIAASAEGAQGAAWLGTALQMESLSDRRIVKIDGDLKRQQSELARHLSIVWQTPQMDGLFMEGLSARRTFLDRLVYGFDPAHAARVAAYEQAMRERNKLLAMDSRDGQWLSVLEMQMVEASLAIAAARNELVLRLNHAILSSTTAFPKAHLSIEGAVEQALLRGEASLMIEQKEAETLAKMRGRDKAAGRALSGVHRSDFQVLHLLKNMQAAECSTGEQKAMLLALLLAYARARKLWQGAAPIILLDEVVAHLDKSRRSELFRELQEVGAQCWMTGTDAADFSAAPTFTQCLSVENASISAA